jgi:hypothetical protein
MAATIESPVLPPSSSDVISKHKSRNPAGYATRYTVKVGHDRVATVWLTGQSTYGVLHLQLTGLLLIITNSPTYGRVEISTTHLTVIVSFQISSNLETNISFLTEYHTTQQVDMMLLNKQANVTDIRTTILGSTRPWVTGQLHKHDGLVNRQRCHFISSKNNWNTKWI